MGQGFSVLPFLFNGKLEALASAIGQEKGKLSTYNRKEKRKWSLFKSDRIVYVENPSECTKTFLELVSEFSKITEYDINTQTHTHTHKSTVFLYTTNEHVVSQIKHIILYTIAPKK